MGREPLVWLALTVIAAGVAVVMAAASPLPEVAKEQGATDPPRSIYVWVDRGTGCHYIGTWDGGLHPRMQRDGRQVCEEAGGENR